MPDTRRGFLAKGLAGSVVAAQTAPDPDTGIDFRKIVARADLTYNTPVPRSEEGMPLGNGRVDDRPGGTARGRSRKGAGETRALLRQSVEVRGLYRRLPTAATTMARLSPKVGH